MLSTWWSAGRNPLHTSPRETPKSLGCGCIFSTPAQWIINYLKQSENLQVDVTHGSGTAEQQRATAVSCKIGGDALTLGEMNKRFHDHFLLFHQCFIECFLLLFLIPEENQPRDRCCPAAQFGNFASERSRASAVSPQSSTSCWLTQAFKALTLHAPSTPPALHRGPWHSGQHSWVHQPTKHFKSAVLVEHCHPHPPRWTKWI